MTDPRFQALVELQELDTRLDQARHRLEHHPARARLASIAETRALVELRRVAAEGSRDEVAARVGALESELAAAERRSGQISGRLYGGTVSASRELQSLATELEGLGRRCSDLEDAVLAVLEEAEPIEAAVETLSEEVTALDAAEEAATVELGEAERSEALEIDRLTSARAEAALGVGAALLADYERLRARLGGVGAARLVGNHCGGCHLVLPATELDGMRRLPPEQVVHCDQCGRILVRP